ncbi:hypothetical protein K502DRAFT_330807 [Neoconidiobolus thromboides FSU 785]|nr:hypothetical protein K502DRAFT_330807 [Neoconidiobolus thromboides FSU 785]
MSHFYKLLAFILITNVLSSASPPCTTTTKLTTVTASYLRPEGTGASVEIQKPIIQTRTIIQCPTEASKVTKGDNNELQNFRKKKGDRNKSRPSGRGSKNHRGRFIKTSVFNTIYDNNGSVGLSGVDETNSGSFVYNPITGYYEKDHNTDGSQIFYQGLGTYNPATFVPASMPPSRQKGNNRYTMNQKENYRHPRNQKENRNPAVNQNKD